MHIELGISQIKWFSSDCDWIVITLFTDKYMNQPHNEGIQPKDKFLRFVSFLIL